MSWLRVAPCGIEFGPVGKLTDSIMVRKKGRAAPGPRAIKKWVDQGAAFVTTLDGGPAETRSLDK